MSFKFCFFDFLRTIAVLFYCAISCCSFVVITASAANLTVLQETKQQDWSYGTMKNDSNGRQFCFAETTGAQSSVFRIVIYKVDKDWFVEAINETWNMRDGTMSFSLEFDGRYGAGLKGKSDGDALTYDLLDHEVTLGLFGLISNNKQMQLRNSNGGLLDVFSLAGSKEAMNFAIECAGL